MFMPSVKRMEEEEELSSRASERALRAEKEGLEIPLGRRGVGGGASLNEAAHKMTATKIQRTDHTLQEVEIIK